MLTSSPVRPSGRIGRAVMASRIQRLVVAIDAPLAERDAPLRRQIGGDARSLRDAVMQRDHARDLLLEPLHAVGKAVAKPFDDLEQAQVDVSELTAEQIVAAIPLQDLLEIAEEFRHAIAPEIPC